MDNIDWNILFGDDKEKVAMDRAFKLLVNDYNVPKMIAHSLLEQLYKIITGDYE